MMRYLTLHPTRLSASPTCATCGEPIIAEVTGVLDLIAEDVADGQVLWHHARCARERLLAEWRERGEQPEAVRMQGRLWG